jgi:exodeoxyribonuclease VII small subunit
MPRTKIKSAEKDQPAGKPGPALEEMLTEVEKQIDSLEKDDLSLEASFDCYKKGMQLLKSCSEMIDRTEKQVLEISGDGSLKVYDGTEENE